MRQRGSGLLAGFLALTIIGQAAVLPVNAEEETPAAVENTGNEAEVTEPAAAEDTGNETDAAEPAAEKTGNETEVTVAAEDTGNETEVTVAAEDTGNGTETEKETAAENTGNETDVENTVNAVLLMAPADSGTFESGTEFSEDIRGLVGDLSSIESIEWTDLSPSGNYVDVGLKHVHTADCYHQHTDACYSTVEVERSCKSMWTGSAVYIGDGDVAGCDCGSGGHKVYYYADIREVRKINGEVISDTIRNSQEAQGCGQCINDKFGFGTSTSRELTCGKSDNELICGYEDENHLSHIYASFRDGVLYLYNASAPGSGASFNEDSSGMFAGMSKLVSLDLSDFDGGLLTNTANMFPESLEALTLNPTFRFSNSSGTLETQGSGLIGSWEKDGEVITDEDTVTPFITQKTYNTSLMEGTFEGRWNAHPSDYAGTWVRNDETHSYYARGQAATTPGGNAWEEHDSTSRFYGYCFAQHLACPNGKYDKIAADDPEVLKEILNQQAFTSVPAADNIRDALITVLYYGYPNDKVGIQNKFGLEENEYATVTWDVLRHYSDSMTAPDYGEENLNQAYRELLNMTYDSIPAEIRNRLHLYVYVSEQHQQHMVAIEGVTTENYGGVSVRKIDAATGAALSGAEFTIYDENGNAVDADNSTEAVDPIVSDSNGYAYICRLDATEGLRMGTYTIRETKAPAGYEPADYSYTFTVSVNGCITRTGTNSKTGLKEKMIFRNEPKIHFETGGIRIRKVIDGDETTGLLGAVYGIYAAEDIVASNSDGNLRVTLYKKDDKVTELTTGEDGFAETAVTTLPLGQYYLKELIAPAGFQNDKEEHVFTVSEAGVLQSETVTLRDVPKTADVELRFRKEILTSGHRLKKGQFTYQLYRLDPSEDGSPNGKRTLVGETRNEANGTIVFNSENTNGALSFTAVENLGQVTFICIEKPGDDNRYYYDTHEEEVMIILKDDGESDDLIAEPVYGAETEKLKTVPIYADDDLIRKNYTPGVFRNCYREPSDISDPTKEVDGGKVLTEKLHNEVMIGENFTYDVLQSIPDVDETDRFRSFAFYDELPAGICLQEDQDKNYAVKITADGTDVTDHFAIDVRKKESSEEADDMQYIVTAQYKDDLSCAGPYGKTYDFHMEVKAPDEVTKATTYTNFARVDIVYLCDENHYCHDENGNVVLNGNGDPVYEAETEYRIPENPKEMETPTTTDSSKAVHSRLTNTVKTDVYPYIPDSGWTIEKQVYNNKGQKINTFAVQHEDTLTYKITVKNDMKKTAGTITVTDPLPEQVTFVDADPKTQYDESKRILTFRDISVKAGQSVTLSFRVHVADGSAIAAIDNKAHAVMSPVDESKEGTSDGSPSSGQETDTQKDRSTDKDTKTMHNYVPQITKMVTDSSGNNINGILVEEGTELTYHLYVTNPDTAGEDPERSGRHTFTITDPIPDHTVYSEDKTKKELSWTTEFAPGETREFTYKVRTVGKGVEIVNAAKLHVQNQLYEKETQGDNSTEQQFEEVFTSNKVRNAVPMDPVKTVTTLDGEDVNRKFLQVGAEYRYSITVDNPGSEKKKYTITDKIPDHIAVKTLESGKKVSGTASEPGTCSIANGVVTFAVLAAPGEKTTVSFTFCPTDKEAQFTNTAHTVLSGNIPVEPITGMTDPEGKDHVIEKDTNEVENWTPADPVKKVTGTGKDGIMKDMDGLLVFGENEDILQYKISFKNNSSEKKTFTITDSPDPDLTFLSASDGGRYDIDSGNVIWTLQLQAGEEREVTFKAKVTCGNTNASADNTAKVYVDDVHLTTNETKTPIDSTPIKKVTDEEGNDIDKLLVGEGEKLVYEIEVHNPAGIEKHFTVTDKIPDKAEYVSADKGVSLSSSPSGAGEVNTVKVSSGKKTITWEADIPAGETYRFVFRVLAQEQGSYIPNDALVSVDGSSIRTNLVENWTPEAPLKAVLKDGSDADGETFTIGDETELSYVITVYNPSSMEKTFTVTDTLDRNLTFLSADNGGSIDGRTVTFTVKVEAGAEKKVTIRAAIIKTPYETKIENTARVSCDLFKAETNEVTVYLKKAPVIRTEKTTKKTVKDTEEPVVSEEIMSAGNPDTGDNMTGRIIGAAVAAGIAITLLYYCFRKKKDRDLKE